MSQILLHTICVEPARWTSQRTSRPLYELLPAIAAAGFTELEIFEPHLAAADSALLNRLFSTLGLHPQILSSYMNFNPATATDDAVERDTAMVMRHLANYGFKKVRIFPGNGMNPEDSSAASLFATRLGRFARSIPDVEILLETHDQSLADDPELLISLLEQADAANIGLLYQPTLFAAEPALRQFRLQKPFIRHMHLQNRHPDGSFSSLEQGVVPWKKILAEMQVPMTLEFVPAGICPVDEFDLERTLQQACSEADYIRKISKTDAL